MPRPCYNVQTCMYSGLEKDLELCAKTGFSGVEISFAKAREYLKDHSLSDLSELLTKYGLKCETINAIFDLSFLDAKRREETRKLFDFACELGAACRSDKVIVLSSDRKDLPEGVSEQVILEDTAKTLCWLADLGRPSGMKIAYEPVGTKAIGSMKTGYELVKKIGRPEIGLAVDDFNMFLYDLCSDMQDIRGFDGEKIFIVHVNDAEKLPFALLDQKHRCMPGDGRIDVKEYLDCIRATGYDGAVSVEVLNPSVWAKGAEFAVPEAYRKLMALLS